MKATILNSTKSERKVPANAIQKLCDRLGKNGISPQIINLEDKKINPCMSCEGCLYITPGKCIQKDDTAEILTELAKSEIIISFTDIIFGGYSSQLKKIVDKFALLATPFYKVSGGNLLHPSRYGIQKYYITVGLYENNISVEEIDNLDFLTKRNAVNLSIPYYKCVVIQLPNENGMLSEKTMLSIEEVSAEIINFIERNEIS